MMGEIIFSVDLLSLSFCVAFLSLALLNECYYLKVKVAFHFFWRFVLYLCLLVDFCPVEFSTLSLSLCLCLNAFIRYISESLLFGIEDPEVKMLIISSRACALEAYCGLANSDWKLGEIRLHQENGAGGGE